MKAYTKQSVCKIMQCYNPEHDLGPNAPVTWREENLAEAVIELWDEVELLKAQVKALLDAVPSAKVTK
jgi:hypothetical protein